MSQSYQVLARKYRPKNFHELVGQRHVSEALLMPLTVGECIMPIVYLTRVSANTIARSCKCLNCETGVTSRPAGCAELAKRLMQVFCRFNRN